MDQNHTLSVDVDISQIQQELKIASDKANIDSNEEIIADLNKIEIISLCFDNMVNYERVSAHRLKCLNKKDQ